MKKILAITLSILLVVGLMPSAFAADAVTISATDVTLLEAEDYRDIFVVDDEGTESVVTIPDESICSDGTYLSSWSGDGWVRYEAKDADSNPYASAYSLIEINVETEGLYTIEYYVRNTGTYSSTGYLFLDGQEYAVEKTSDEWGDFTKYYLTVNLDAAIHAVGYKTYKAGTNCYFAYDYIAIKPYTAVDVASEGVTKINGEDMKTLSGETSLVGKLASDDAADGGSYFSYDQDMNVGVATSTAKINVPETGKYKITAKLFWQVNYTGYTLTVDDTTIGTIASSTDDTKVDSWKTIGSVVELDEGEHTLTITSEGRYGHQDSYIDYVDIAPEAAPLNVAATGVAKAEAEDYLTFDRILVNSTDSTTTESSEVASVASDVNDSSIEYFSATDQFSGYTHTQTWNLPIYVEADGEYKISFRILNNNSYEGSLSTLLDGTELEAIGEPNDGLWETYTYIEELTAGDHTVSVSSTHTNGNAQLKIDYVTVAEAYPANPSAVDITEETKFEAEDYRWITVVDAEGAETEVYMPDSSIEAEGSSYELAYSGDGWVRHDGYGDSKIYSTIDINIPEDGVYELTYRVRNSGKNSSINNLLVDGESIYTMPNSSDTWVDFDTYTTKHIFTEGTHTLGYEANGISSNSNCYFAYDYISIVPKISGTVNVPESGVVKAEAEDYLIINRTLLNVADSTTTESLVVADVATDENDSDITYVKATEQKSGYTHTQVWNLPISVATAKEYKISFRILNNNSYEGSLSTLLDGTELEAIGEPNDGLWETYTYTEELAAGDHTLSVSSTHTNGNAVLKIDYVTIEEAYPANPGVIDITEEKVFEAEDYRWITVVDAEGAETEVYIPDSSIEGEGSSYELTYSGDGWVRHDGYGDSKIYSTIDINIPEDGMYELTYYVRNSGGNSSTNNLLVDGESIYTMPNSSDNWNDFSTYTITDTFTKGPHTLGYEANTASTGNSNCFFAYDYISIKPVVIENVSVAGRGVTTINATDYPYANAYNEDGTFVSLIQGQDPYGLAGQEAVRFVLADTDADVSSNDYVEWTVPLTVEVAGTYKATFSVAGGSGTYSCSKRAIVNGTEVGTAGGSWNTLYTIEADVTLNKGSNEIGIRSYARASGGDNDFEVVSVTLENAQPTNPDAVIITEETKFEAESYRWITVVDAEGVETEVYIPDSSIEGEGSSYELTYSGDGWVRYDGYGNSKIYSTININIPEDGAYKLTYYVRNSGKNSSTNYLLVDGEPIYTTSTSSDNWNDYSTYTLTEVFTKGAHTLGYEANTASTGNKNCFFAYDYISIKPVESIAVAGSGVTTIKAVDYAYAKAYNEDGTFVSLIQGQDPYGLAGQEAVRFVLADTDADVSANDYVEWTVPLTVEAAGTYKATFSVAGGSGTYSCSKRAIVNGTEVGTAGGSWNTLYTIEADVTLNEGKNEIGIRSFARPSGGDNDFEVVSVTLENTQPTNSDAVIITEETKFEAEDYRWITVVDAEGAETEVYIPDSSIEGEGSSFELTYSGDGWVRYDGYGNSKIYSAIDIYIPEDGMYELTYYVRNSGANSSTNNLLVDGESIYTMPSTGDDWDNFDTYTAKYVFTKGAHTLGYEANTASTGNSNCYFAYDYISIKPVEPVVVTENGVTTINAVDYACAKAYNEDGTFVSLVQGQDPYGLAGQEAVRFVLADTDADVSASDYVEWTVPVTVEETGVYNVTFSLAGGSGWYACSKKAIVNGKEVGTAGGSWNAVTTILANVALSAGKNEVGIRSYARPSAGDNDFEVVSVAIENSQSIVELSATDAVVVQAENYIIKNLTGEAWTVIESDIITDEDLGATYVDSKYTNAGGTNYLDIQVNSPETRFYKITPKLQDIQHETGYSIYVNDNKLADLSSAGDAKGWFEASTYVELTEGTHTITIRSTGNYGHRRIVADCITISPESYDGAEEVTISGKDITYIEAENYDTYETISNGLTVYGTVSDEYFVSYEGAHGTGDANCIRWNAYGQEYVAFNIPIVIEQSGYYEVDFNSAASGSYTGMQDLYLDGELFVEGMVLSNTAADAFRSTLGHDKYLEAGSYTLTIKSTKTTANPNCYYYTDYVSFKPVSYIEESATAGTYDVTVVYDEPVSGIIAAAAYNKDNKLLTMTKVDVTNAERHSFQLTDVPTDEALRVIKIFAWDTECNPQDVRQDIFYNPVDTDPFAGDDEINIVYIGGSLTQGSGSTFGGWAGLASDYFKEKYGADKVVNHNVGIGGTTSQYGMFRLAQDVVSKNPDLVFIEFVLNDGGNNAARGASMETMVRTLLEMDKVPYVNFVYTKHKGSGYIVPHYHTQVARHYGIPEIYVKDSYVDEETENTRYPVTDSVHPNDAGYRAWYAEIEKCLVTDKYYQRPIQQNEAVFDASGILMASALDKFTFEKSGNWTEDTTYNRLISSTAGDSVSFSFTGNSIAFVISGNSTYGNYSVTIDGVNKGTFSGTEVGWDQMNHFFTDLGDGEHDVTITVVDRVSTDETTGETTVLGSYFCIEDIFVGDLIG